MKLRLNTLIDGLSAKLRQIKLRPVVEALWEGATVLDIGVWSRMPEPHASENWLEKQDTDMGRLIAVGLESMEQFRERYPLALCVQADGTALPFKDGTVDVAVANAVLEHIALKGQGSFIREIARVVRKWALITVPDRWCPIEIHSRILLAHWLPCWRTIFEKMGQGYWASPVNLALFTRASLLSLLEQATMSPGSWHVTRQRFLGIPVSLIACYRRNEDWTPDHELEA